MSYSDSADIMPRLYLDHAATSWPKDDAVLDAMDRFARDVGATSGRGGYASASKANAIVAQTRHAIAGMIHAEDDACISIHDGGTSALNAAIHGVLRPGDHVVTTAAEHNSVLRPIHHWQTHHHVQVTIVPTDADGSVSADDVIAAVTDKTRLVAVTHASNVTGAVQPIGEIGNAIADHPAIFLCDAAQTFGVLPIDVAADHIDLLAAPGHKSSGGPSGTGFLYACKRIHDQITPWCQGGTGNQSESLAMPSSMPSMLEAGNLNVPALAGWLAALQTLAPETIEARQTASRHMAISMHQRLRRIAGIKLLAPPDPSLPIASLVADDFDPSDLASILDVEFGIETRSGLHCAALIHDCIGSQSRGTLRVSGSHATTAQDVEAVGSAIEEIVAIADENQ